VLFRSTKSVSSIWKLNSPQKQHLHAQNLANGVHFNSIDNLADDYSNKHRCNNNYAQLETPRSRQQQYRSSMYNPNHHYYYLNADNSSNKSKLDSNISKSIDGLYTVPNQNLANSFLNETNVQSKKTALLDVNDDYKELPVSFQPVNFTSNRPKQNTDYLKQNTFVQPPPPPAKIVRENFKRDSLAEKKRASIGKFPQNLNYSTVQVQRTNEVFQPIPTHRPQHQQSARERLFGNNQSNYSYMSQVQQQQQQLRQHYQHYQLQQQQQTVESENLNNRKIAMVKPELRGSCEKFTQQNQMEYFDADYSEEINKNMSKPEIFTIPTRGNLDLEPEMELSDEEQRAKEKRMLEIKKMIALQSLQQIDDLNNLNSTYNFYGKQNTQNTSNYLELNFEKEKKAREQLIDLRHELAEQIKEKSRHTAHMAALNGSNGYSTSTSTSSSIPIEIENNKSNESKMESMTYKSPNNDFSMQNLSSSSFFNSTPAPPPAAFHSIFNLNSTGSYN